MVSPSSAFATSVADKPRSKTARIELTHEEQPRLVSSRTPLGGYCFISIFSMTSVLYKSPSSTLPSMANTQSIPPFGAEK